MDHDFWARRWQEKRTRWDRGAISPALEYWFGALDTLPRRVLIPGCGSGYEVEWLARRGVQVTAIDIVAEPLQTLRGRLHNLSADLVHADLFDWEPEEPFDAIYEQTCLCVISPEQRHDYALRLHRWLRPGGLLYALFAQTPWEQGPPWHCDLTEMRGQHFTSDRWQWPERADFIVPHPAGFEEHGYRLVKMSAD